MKNFILRLIYEKYRPYFYNLLVEETLASMPQEVSEPAMTFLAGGKEKITRWGYYWIQIIQARIVTDKNEIEVQQGMIIMLKIFINLVRRQSVPKVQTKGREEDKKTDHVAEVESAISDFMSSKKTK